MTGNILAIERCSLHDGPGIRTTVFLKGCPLRCWWCHNPESQSRKPELLFYLERCTNCGDCEKVCAQGCHAIFDGKHAVGRSVESACTACGKCTEACPNQALEIKGSDRTVDEIIRLVENDRRYYEQSQGGMTLSGGEPLMQPEFTRSLLEAAKCRGIHTCCETCGFGSEESFRKIASQTDLFLFDCKETSPEKHKEFTGGDLSVILHNLNYLDSTGIPFVLRCPLVPGLNARDDHFRGLAELANILKHIQAIEVMPFHPMGAAKNRQLGKAKSETDGIDFVNETQAEQWRAEIRHWTRVLVS